MSYQNTLRIANLRKMRPENKNARRGFSDGGP
jgi:hypothetical protein